MAKAEVKSISPFLTTYELPGGPKLTVKKPKNQVRRLLVENPEQQVRFLLDTIAAVSLTELVIPAGYSDKEELKEGKTFTFDPEDKTLDATAYNRFDDLDLLDMQAFSAAFEVQNMPTKAMIEAITEQIRKAKEQGKA